MISNPYARNPLLISLPAAWVVVRRYRSRELRDLRRWLDAAAHELRLPDVWEAADEYLTESSSTVADLSHWAMLDLPTGQAHFIDIDTDLAWAVVLLTVLQEPAALRRVRGIGEGVYGRRARFFQVIADAKERAGELAQDLGVPEIDHRLSALTEFLQTQVSAHERREREGVRNSRLSSRALEVFARAAQEAWRSGQPRFLMQSTGAVVRVQRGRAPRGSKLGIHRLEAKDLFVDDAGYVDGTWEQIGRHFGEAFVRGESEALAGRMPTPRRRRHQVRDINVAIEAAAARLRAKDVNPTHILVPPSWRLQESLGLDLVIDEEHVHGSGLRVFEWVECPPAAMFVLSLPGSVEWTQYVLDDQDLTIEVLEIGELEEEQLRGQGIHDVDGDPSDSPSERIRSRVWLRMHEYVRIAVRPSRTVAIALPDELSLQ